MSLNDISGSGKDGRVLKEDILNFLKKTGDVFAEHLLFVIQSHLLPLIKVYFTEICAHIRKVSLNIICSSVIF